MIPVMNVSVLIVDDHAGFRQAARTLLEAMGAKVVGESASGEEAIEAVDTLDPDVILLDVQLPGIDGIEVARRVLELSPRRVVVLTSSRDREEYGARLRAAPAAIFIAKVDLSQEAISGAIEAAS